MNDDAKIERFRKAAIEAVSAATPMRVVLKGGETLQGIPERISSDAENAPSAWNPPMTPEEQQHFGPVEYVLTIAGKEILAQEVEEFAVLDAAV
jgi:hypothetical protein